ncbi:helix-turn-helix transcriptional regulator [Streptacidiphilus cavernicola]|uniref:LuxR C-terminal-related transcriptional regulator n=1 Tax=Streptacidiphilus cavernicola TaxID=3342716 RepID=A0ABV6W2L0_9ACTN
MTANDTVLPDVYAWAVAQRHITPDDVPRMADELGHDAAVCHAALTELTRRHVLLPDGDGYLAASPDLAITALVGPRESAHRETERQLAAAREQTSHLRHRLTELTPLYLDRNQHGTAPGIDALTDKFAVRALISDLTAGCDKEIMACQPGGGRPPAALADALPRDLELLRRGVELRSLYQHTARFHAPTQQYAEAVLQAGSRIRTVAEIPCQMIVIDRRTAVLPHHEYRYGAVIVRDPSILAYLCTTFEQAWNLGAPYQTGPSAARSAVTEIKAAILTLMANGLKDEVIAKRMGLSVRACRGHIADLLSTLNAHSRFQAGVIAERDGLLEPRDDTD